VTDRNALRHISVGLLVPIDDVASDGRVD